VGPKGCDTSSCQRVPPTGHGSTRQYTNDLGHADWLFQGLAHTPVASELVVLASNPKMCIQNCEVAGHVVFFHADTFSSAPSETF
jgi:hypothetical protein